jgi:predicted AAA+ superfamily ATPase
MNRELPAFLTTWRAAKERKPLILKGTRQVGKTTSLKEFGKRAFEKYHYFNFERQKTIHSIFEHDSNPDSIANALSVVNETKIDLQNDLIIFDEIQECPQALTSLKYFCEEKPGAYIVCAGSLLGVKLSEESFPVGKVEIHTLFPLSFMEFLEVTGKELLAQAIMDPSGSIQPAILESASTFFKHYCVTGGLPEIVQTYIDLEGKSDFERFFSVREKQKNLIETYENDMAKHSGKINSMHLRRVWEDVPRQLSKVNSKFQFKNVIPGKKSFADLAGPLDWLLNAGLIIQSSIVNEAQIPLKGYVQQNQFRLFCFDIGILAALSDFPFQMILNLEKEDLIFKGHFLENFVAQILHRHGFPLYTWVHNTSEIEFLIQNDRGNVFPIEVKSRLNSKAKSLKVFLEKYPHILDFAVLSLSTENHGRHFPITILEKLIRRKSESH